MVGGSNVCLHDMCPTLLFFLRQLFILGYTYFRLESYDLARGTTATTV